MWQLLIILLIVLLIFGTKRLKSVGGDLGAGLKSFRKAIVNDDETDSTSSGDESRQLEAGEPDAEFAEQKDKSKSNNT